MQEINKILNCRKEVIFLDFEGTQFSQEIFAIGAIKVLLDNKNRVNKKSSPFKVYVKTQNKIGSIIEKLTGISDDFIKNNGILFSEAIANFKKYCGSDYKKYLFITYGNFDKKLLSTTQHLNNLDDDDFINTILKNSWDISLFFNHYLKGKNGQQLSLKESLETFHITFSGTEHDPSDDAINLMLLYDAFLDKKGIVFEQYKKTLDKYNRMPRPFILLIQKLNEKGSVTSEDYEKLILEDLK